MILHVEAAVCPGPAQERTAAVLSECVARVWRPAGRETESSFDVLRAALGECGSAGVLLATADLRRIEARAALAILALVAAVDAPDIVAPSCDAGEVPPLAFYHRRLLGRMDAGTGDLPALLAGAEVLWIPLEELRPLGWS
ncbi:MAG: hypothetical protein J4G09_00810 [Proteobacteria bacterium]|nr:hypothetical protein [Pseudomonadota bacterium]